MNRLFFFENFSLSVLLHATIALVIVGFAFVMPPPKIIAPDRIKIIDIDLRDVKISGLETKLKNMEKKNSAENPKPDKKSDAKIDKKSEPVIQTIKVNREVSNLERTMTISVIDAFRVAMTRCWQIDSECPDLAEIRAVAHIKLYPNGRVQSYWFEQAIRAEQDSAFAYVLDTIRLAIDACQPFSMLPRNEYDKWKTVQLTFFPTAKVVE
ncbi:MAG: hypothetical protein LBD94_00435 [Rickettsiales bacterium]|jgi:hypothetical protein|nr:hypothetical protein [Rickettsiales bacterium]